jgi:hypothetical protein
MTEDIWVEFVGTLILTTIVLLMCSFCSLYVWSGILSLYNVISYMYGYTYSVEPIVGFIVFNVILAVILNIVSALLKIIFFSTEG